MKPEFPTTVPKTNIYQDKGQCPLLYALQIVGPKWKLPIIGALYEGKQLRYNQLKRTVVGITNLMLTKSLRELEQDGLVQRIVYDEASPHVEYTLTDRGCALVPTLNALYTWGEEQLAWQHQRGNQGTIEDK